ncbi:hypothetical protein BJX65DRAFT_284425 [Aspergillus insuetus]
MTLANRSLLRYPIRVSGLCRARHPGMIRSPNSLTRPMGELRNRSRVCENDALSPKGQRSSGTLHAEEHNINLKVLSTFLQTIGCTF